MKRLLLFLLLVASTSFGQTYTNGVYVNKGQTTEVEKKVYSITPTNSSETLYFSNHLIVNVYTNSDFTINSFFQEVYDIENKAPHKSKFGGCNLAATLMNGTAVVVYSGSDSNSSCVISTPMTDLELHKGVFYFKVSQEKVLIFVLEGSLTSHGDKSRENVVTAGYAVIAVPNDIGILEAKISLGSEKVKQSVIDKLLSEAKPIIGLRDSIMFATINGKQMGILIN